MNASEIFTKLTQQGVDFWVEDNKLNIRSPKGVITPEIQANIIKYKADILALVQEMNIDYQFKFDPSTKGISLQAIGKLISGFSGGSIRRISSTSDQSKINGAKPPGDI